MDMEANGGAVLRAADIWKRYGEAVVLRGVSLEAAPGASLAIVGPSGSGKSTLLNILGTLDTPSSGTVHLGGAEVSKLEGDALSRFRAATVGFVFQDHCLLPQLSALENVQLPLLAQRARDDAGRAAELLERMDVGHRASAPPAQLSGGERQRVAVARALMGRPRILLCDEPTGSLDRAAGELVIAALLHAAAIDRVTVVLVTHNADHAARCDRQAHLEDGRLEIVA